MARITVYIDGDCPMCVAGANRFKKFDKADAVHFVNARDPKWAAEAAERFSHDELGNAMRVRMPNGTWRTGYFAWAAILQHLAGFQWLGCLMLLPIFYGIGPSVYGWVANHRLQISKAMRLPPPCDENGVCRLGKA